MASLFERVKGTLLRSKPLQEERSQPGGLMGWLSLFGGNHATSGAAVNDHSAVQISTVYSCIRVLASSVASLPLRLYKTENGVRQEVVNDPLAKALRVSPNSDSTSFSFWETVMVHLCLTGNFYAELTFGPTGEVTQMWPLAPRLTHPFRLPSGELAFKTSDAMAQGSNRLLEASRVLHIPLMSHDGIVGMSPIEQCRETLGLAISSAACTSRFFANFSTPSLAIEIPEAVDAKTKTLMREDWEALQGGPNQHRIAVLDQGQKLSKLSLSPQEAEWLELRKYTAAEICGIFSVPPHMVSADNGARLSNANVENLNLSFYQDCLRGYLVRIEAALAKTVLATRNTGAVEWSAEFDVSARLRGDQQSTMAAIASGRQWGIYTANDGRRMLGLNPLGPESDTTFSPVNMANAKVLLTPAGVAPQVQEDEIAA